MSSYQLKLSKKSSKLYNKHKNDVLCSNCSDCYVVPLLFPDLREKAHLSGREVKTLLPKSEGPGFKPKPWQLFADNYLQHNLNKRTWKKFFTCIKKIHFTITVGSLSDQLMLKHFSFFVMKLNKANANVSMSYLL